MVTITEDYVSFEVAKLLNEKKFNCSSYSHYRLNDGKLCYFNTNCNTNLKQNDYITAPTLQMAMKWLRVEHNIHIESFCPVVDITDEPVKYNVVISDLKKHCLAFDTPLEDKEFDSYEKACEAAIKYTLENLI